MIRGIRAWVSSIRLLKRAILYMADSCLYLSITEERFCMRVDLCSGGIVGKIEVEDVEELGWWGEGSSAESEYDL